MSGTQPAAPAPTPEWRAPAGLVSIYSLTILLVALGVACYLNNATAITLLIGVIATNATTVVNYYMGSSHGSQAKDATIAGQLPTPPPPSPLANPPAGPAAPTPGAPA